MTRPQQDSGNETKRCNLRWCWRKAACHIEIGFPGTDYWERIPYCEKHGQAAQEIIDENNIMFTSKGKARFEPKQD